MPCTPVGCLPCLSLQIYLQGSDEIKQDYKQAYYYLKKASELNDPVGHSGLGLLYLHGKGVPKDYKKAFKYFQSAAEQGWVDGQLQLGNMYFSMCPLPCDRAWELHRLLRHLAEAAQTADPLHS